MVVAVATDWQQNQQSRWTGPASYRMPIYLTTRHRHVCSSGTRRVARGCPKLRSLSVNHCNGVTNNAVTALAGLPVLKSLYLNDCDGWDCVHELARSPSLNSVNFSGCVGVARWSMEAMDTSRKAAGLPEVSWEGEYGWSDESDAESE